jgi:hypothetical protein
MTKAAAMANTARRLQMTLLAKRQRQTHHGHAQAVRDSAAPH